MISSFLPFSSECSSIFILDLNVILKTGVSGGDDLESLVFQ